MWKNKNPSPSSKGAANLRQKVIVEVVRAWLCLLNPCLELTLLLDLASHSAELFSLSKRQESSGSFPSEVKSGELPNFSLNANHTEKKNRKSGCHCYKTNRIFLKWEAGIKKATA